MLVVNPTPFWGIMLCRTLKELSIEGEWVKNGKRCIDKIQEKKDYAGIFMSINMPVINGIETTRKILSLGFQAPIIGFSSMGEDEDIAKGLKVGISAYIRRTVEIEKIRILLEQLEIIQ